MSEAAIKVTRTLVGRIVSDKRSKTVTVLVERRAKHALYGKVLRKTSRLILVGSAGALASDPVLRELEAFHRTGRRIVPIDFGGTSQA